MNYYNGYRILTSDNMVEPGEPYQVKRTIKERLFFRPWKPFKKYNTVTPMVPMKKIIAYKDFLLMHPEIYELLKLKIIKNDN